MAGLVPAIHVFDLAKVVKTWMPGTRPGMTEEVSRNRAEVVPFFGDCGGAGIPGSTQDGIVVGTGSPFPRLNAAAS